MSRRPSSAALFLLGLLFLAFPRVAFGQTLDAPASPRLNFSLISTMPAPVADRLSAVKFDVPSSSELPSGPSKLMTALYAATALTQGLDAHSTLKALNAGATERNPLMSFLTSHPPAFLALKTSAAAGLIFAGQRIAKHNKVHAALALVAVNSAYLVIATHNYRVASRLR